MLHGMVAGMLHELTRPLAAGDTGSLEFRFAKASPVVARVPVLRYSEAVEEALSSRP